MFKQNIENRIEELDMSNLRKNNPKYLVIHSTRSYPEFEDLNNFHKGKGWSGVGYHFFISKSNKVSQARPVNIEGAHALGYNLNSIGLCFYAPNSKIKLKQLWKGKRLIKTIKEMHPKIKTISHSQTQLNYINKLFQNYGIKKEIDETLETYKQEIFEKTKEEIDNIVGMLSTDQHHELKQRMKLFTNCPGELYKHFK